ncbi:ABC-type transport auxiliary lipoprotein family protein [Chelativorans intermedius]|uniref:ABC-type transport auxiliary lipoprotein family protein n=1 Tax=Chelativorans intermedius TaxID=515947 RepID=UPI0028F70BD9|nr:ABC-type transport auxiliary lipoprotein family protein [Chelativorans intermedius]
MSLRGSSIGGLALAGLLLGGCAAIPGFGPPPVDAYDISAPMPPDSGRRLSRTQILVPEPSALKILDGQDLVVRAADGTVQLLGGARWSDRLPRLVQARLIEAYQRSGRIGGVGRPGEGLAIDYQVIVDIRTFEIRAGTSGERAHVELYARVLNDRNGVVRAGRSFTVTAPVVGSGAGAFVAALDRAFQSAAVEIVDWSIGVM